MRRRIEITVERYQRVTIRPGRGIVAWCEACGAPVEMLSPEQAAVLAGLSTRTVYRWVEAGTVHFIDTADGSLRICARSLPRP